MTTPTDQQRRALLVGYDASPAAAMAIEVAAQLLPVAEAHVAHVWATPFLSPHDRQALYQRAGGLDGMMRRLEQEGAAKADRFARQGATLARAAGWEATPLSRRSVADQGVELARLAAELGVDAVVVGGRGLSGARAVLGSVSDSVVHYSPVPVLMIPEPMLEEERRAVGEGPVVVGYDGSPGARRGRDAASRLFPGRTIEVAGVGSDADGRLGDDYRDGAVRVELEPAGVAHTPAAVAEAIARHARDVRAAAVVVGSRGRSATREVLLGSVAMATLHRARRPVLVVPAPR